MTSTRSSSSSSSHWVAHVPYITTSPAPLAFIKSRTFSRKTTLPLPPTGAPRYSRKPRNPIAQFIYEPLKHGNHYSDNHHHTPKSSSSSVTRPDLDNFDPTVSIRPTRIPSPAPKSAASVRMQELQKIPCTEERRKLVAGKILNRGGRPQRDSKRSSSPCPNEYVRSRLSNVTVVAGDS